MGFAAAWTNVNERPLPAIAKGDLHGRMWVLRDNTAAFGGDPSHVMVFGQSGGGAKIATLMAMPAAGVQARRLDRIMAAYLQEPPFEAPMLADEHRVGPPS